MYKIHFAMVKKKKKKKKKKKRKRKRKRKKKKKKKKKTKKEKKRKGFYAVVGKVPDPSGFFIALLLLMKKLL